MTEADAGAKRVFGKETVAKCAAEFLASAMLLFFGCMGCIADYEVTPVAHHMPALTFGLTVLLAVHIFAHISGAHISPTITLVAAIFGHLDPITALVYIAGQFSGAIFGLGCLKMLVPTEYTARTVFDVETNSTIVRSGFCVTVPLPNVSSMQAIGIEAVITGVLILICCSIWDKRNEDKHDSVAIRLGLAIAAMAMAAAPFSGGSMNTARSFAPALLSGNWEHQWIYWVGPQLGGVVAAYLYKYLFALEDRTVDEGEGEGEVEPLKSTKDDVA